MLPKRLSVKFFAREPGDIDLSRFVPIYQRWIQTHAVDDLLIDAADYKHVHQGPGVILIGHEGDYGFDLGDGHPGLLYTRKRDTPDNLQDYLALVFHRALSACQKLESEESIDLQFDYDSAKLTFVDRLNTPNTPETLNALSDDIRAFITHLYETDDIRLTSVHDDPREALAVEIVVSGAVTVESLLERLSARVTLKE